MFWTYGSQATGLGWIKTTICITPDAIGGAGPTRQQTRTRLFIATDQLGVMLVLRTTIRAVIVPIGSIGLQHSHLQTPQPDQ